MDADDPIFTMMKTAGAAAELPDDVWQRVLDVALDPTAEPIDADLVPEMDDTPVVYGQDDPDEDGIVLVDDVDDLPLAGDMAESFDLDDGPDDLDDGDGDDISYTAHHDTTVSDEVDLTVDDGSDADPGPDLGDDLF